MVQAKSAEPSRRRIVLVLVVLLVAVAVAVSAYSVGRLSTRASTAPTSNGPEAGFARDMQVHHTQGVQLALIVRDATDDPEIRTMAYDIATTQAQQSGQMYGWLATWGLPQYSNAAPMAWMPTSMEGSQSAASPPPADGTMPGLATPEQIAALADSSGVEAERLFLELMITHHLGAVEMAQGVLGLTDNPVVTTLAQSILASQQAEIDTMRKMLAERQ